MPRKPLITAALATGVAITGAQARDDVAAEITDDHATDIVEFLPDVAVDDDMTRLFLDYGAGDDAPDGDVLVPAAIDLDPLDDEIGIEFAQTWGGGSGNDGIVGAPRRGGVSPDKRLPPGNGITLDNGLKRGGRITTDGNGTAGAVKRTKPGAGKRIDRKSRRKRR